MWEIFYYSPSWLIFFQCKEIPDINDLKEKIHYWIIFRLVNNVLDSLSETPFYRMDCGRDSFSHDEPEVESITGKQSGRMISNIEMHIDMHMTALTYPRLSISSKKQLPPIFLYFSIMLSCPASIKMLSHSINCLKIFSLNGRTHVLICGFIVSYTFLNSVMLINKIRYHNVRAGRWEVWSNFGECEQEVADYNCEVQVSKWKLAAILMWW